MCIRDSIFYPDQERGGATRVSLGWPEDRQVLLYVGRLSPEKNVRRLIQAFSLLNESAPGRFHLVVVGDGPLRGALQRLQ